MIVPLWVVGSFDVLGMVLVIFYPLALSHAVGRSFAWYVYGVALISAVYSAYWTRRRLRTTVVERSERGVVYRVSWRDDDDDAATPRAVGPMSKP